MHVARLDANKWAISARGFADLFANKLLVMIDGRSVYTPSFSGTYWEVQDLMLEDVERIEVVRGPGGTLWGANAVNGVIHIITKHAKDTLGGLLTGGLGSEERGFGALRYGATLAPKTYLRVYSKYFDRGELVDADRRGSDDDWHIGRAGFRLDSELSHEDSLMVEGDYYRGMAGQTYRLAGVPTPPHTRVFDDDAHVDGHRRELGFRNGVEPSESERGEVVIRVEVESEAERRAVLHFSVADTGIGIAPERLERIFESFAQADGSTTRQYGGTGMGTTISKQLVEMMGGRIWAESQVGRGSIFHFVVPFGLAPAQPPIAPRGDLARLKGSRVLIVDDNEVNRQILRDMTAAWGLVPTTVASAADALDALAAAVRERRPFRLLLADGHMPGTSGFELAETVKASPAYRDVAIVLLTSAGRRGDGARCRDLGVSAYLLKPIKQSELYDAIATVLDTGRAGSSKSTLVTRHTLGESRRRLRILLAEDNPVNQKVSSAMLEKRGHSVVVAADGREALDALDRQGFDLVLMDCQMPEMDGFEATRAIRRREEGAGTHLPIVALTAHAMAGDRQLCLDAGMDDYLAKPVSPDKLFAVLESLAPEPAAPGRTDRQPTTPPSPQAFDLDAGLRTVAGDADLLREIGAIFCHDSPDQLARIRDAARRGDAEALRRAAHTLKGSASNFGADAVRRAACAVERAAAAGDLDNVDQLLDVLEADLSRLESALSALAESATP